MSRAPKQPPKQPTGAAPQHTQGTRDAAGTHAPAPPAAPLERMGTLTLGPVFTLPLDQIALAPKSTATAPRKP